jgi:tetratricopeptide (TPR) repeat protein
MRLSTIGAVALFGSLSAAPAAAQYAASQPAPAAQAPAQQSAAGQPVIAVSKEAAKAIGEYRKAVLANDVAAIPATLAAAQKAATTKEDRYFIGELQLKAALVGKDRGALSAAVEAIAASGGATNDRLGKLYSGLGVEYFNANEYGRAAELFQRAATLDPTNLEPLTLLAKSQSHLDKPEVASATYQKVIKQSLAAGIKPDETTYHQAWSLIYKTNQALALDLARQWLAAYPSPDSWTTTIAIYRNTAHPDYAATLDLLRLMRANGSLTRPEDFNAYVATARDLNNFAEAQAVLAEGIAAKQIKPDDPLVAELKTKPAPTLEDLAAAAKTAPTPRSLMGIGDRYYGLGEYAKAADIYRQVLAKGGESNLANLHLGMALARSGDKAGASAALNAVAGPNAGIAKFWSLYVQQQS